MNFSNLPSDKLQKIADLCKARGVTVGFAESCTGGLLSAWMVSLPSVSKIFQGSVVSYSGDVKENVLKVPRPCLLAHGEVSQPVACAMARGTIVQLGCSWSVSITGIAGPSGGTVDKPVGMVCFAVCGPAFEESKTKFFDSKLSRAEIQRQSALFALDFLLDAMK